MLSLQKTFMQAYLQIAPIASLIFAATIILSLMALNNNELLHRWMLHPYSIWRKNKYHTLITSGMIHRDVGHLFFNMISYYFFAFTLESTVGHWQFALIYFGGMLLGDSSSLYKYRDTYGYYSLGASGAICAVVFSAILFAPLSSMYVFPIPFPIPAVLYGVLFLAYCAYAARKGGDYINHEAHFLGALAGVFITLALYPQVLTYFLQQIFS